MGYRSDVALCLSTKGKQALDTALLEASQSHEYHKEIRDFVNSAEVRTDDESGDVSYLWTEIKWYADYVEVKFIEHFVNTIDDDEYLFIRIGESDDDLEYLGGHWENGLGMTLIRSIVFGG